MLGCLSILGTFVLMDLSVTFWYRLVVLAENHRREAEAKKR
jgi:hypothetical protein